MASVTLAEAGKLTQNELAAGVIEDVITVNPIYEVLPFDGIDSNAIEYNRENVLGDVQSATVGDTITAKAAATFTKVTTSLTKIIGDAEVDNLIQAVMSDSTDQTAYQISSKAKSVGRSFQNQMITGDGTGNTFEGLLTLAPASQIVTGLGANGDSLSFAILDELLDLVTAKDGEVDFIMMPARTVRAYKALLRGLGGAGIEETIRLPSGRTLPSYSGVPIFRNDWIPVDQDKGTSTGVCTTIFAGCFDDGSRKVGMAGLNAQGAAGIRVNQVGEMEAKDEIIWRIKWYCSFALFSQRALSYADGILD
jgi:hypothetical protein